jgi:prephenate dehydratase
MHILIWFTAIFWKTHQNSISWPYKSPTLIDSSIPDHQNDKHQSTSHHIMENPPPSALPSEENLQVSYLGPPASYTHQAALDSFRDPKYQLQPETTIEDVFTAVANGSSSRGVVPFENSSNGSVVFTFDLFANLSGKYSDIVVVNEAYVRVNHCIVGHRDDNAPTGDYSHITKLYSHPQAWGQCKHFLSTHLKHAEKQDVSSTSRGAALVAANPTDTHTAALSSALAAHSNNLAILASNIQDSSSNTTRFLIIRRLSDVASLEQRTFVDAPVEAEAYKTLVSFTVAQHGAPGALADCLAVFKKHAITLTSINSRPSGEASWHYVFFVEFKGRKRADGQGGVVNAALEDLGQVAKGWRWLGSFEDAAGYAQ